MTQLSGYMGRVLRLDLSNETIREVSWTDEDRKMFVGGEAMATKLIDILSLGSNGFVLATGPLTGTPVPASTRFSISFISPYSHQLTHVNGGSLFGNELKRAGIDAVVVQGVAKEPMWIEITENGCYFHQAIGLWGMTTFRTQEFLSLSVKKSIKLVIGPAGEHKIPFSTVYSMDRSMGKGGLGAVFGCMNLKAITVKGSQFPSLFAEKDLFRLIHKKEKSSQFSSTCNGCRMDCGKIIKKYDVIIKSYEHNLLKKIGLENDLNLKLQADELGLDLITILENTPKESPLSNPYLRNLSDGNETLSFEFKHEHEKADWLQLFKLGISACGICTNSLPFKNQPVSWFRKWWLLKSVPYAVYLNKATGLKYTNFELIELGKRQLNIEKKWNEGEHS